MQTSTLGAHTFPITGGPRRKHAYEPLLLENEREAVADLLQYLESTFTTSSTTEKLSFIRQDNYKLLHGFAARRAHDLVFQ